MNKKEKFALKAVIYGCASYSKLFATVYYDDESDELIPYSDAIRIMNNYLKKENET